MSLYAFHLGQIISTVLGQVDHGDQDGNAARTRIRDETSETNHTQKRRFRYGAISRTKEPNLAVLRCLYGWEIVLLGVVDYWGVRNSYHQYFSRKWSWHTHDYMSICGLQLEMNSSGPILVFFRNLFDRNIIGIHLSMLFLIWCTCKIVNILWLKC